jgi:hypothetical protein
LLGFPVIFASYPNTVPEHHPQNQEELMHSVLIAFQEPEEKDGNATGKWMTLWQDRTLPDLTTSGVERFSANVWLIQLKTAMPIFCGLAGRADHWGVPYKVYFFEEEPEWVYSRGHPQSVENGPVE